MLVYSASALGFVLGDDLAFVFSHKVMWLDIFASIKTQAVNPTIAENRVSRNSTLDTGIMAAILQDSVIVAVNRIQDVEHAAFPTKIRVALSSVLKTSTSRILKADHVGAAFPPTLAALPFAFTTWWAGTALLAWDSVEKA